VYCHFKKLKKIKERKKQKMLNFDASYVSSTYFLNGEKEEKDHFPLKMK
jgi:hypothetical protein